MNRAVCLSILLGMVSLFPSWGQQQPQERGPGPMGDLRVFENVAAKRLELRMQLTQPLALEKVEAAVEGKALPVQFIPFGAPGKPDTCALLFLIDKSDPKRARTIEAARTLTQQMIEKSAPHTTCAVYAFDANLEQVAKFGLPWGDVASKLRSVKAAGMATELYRNTIEAIGILDRSSVERRGIVILSDGKAEDTTYSIERAIELAKKAGVTIFTVGYAETPQSTVYLQSLRRLAAETGGTFVEADPRTRQVSPEFVNSVHAVLRSGGFASVDVSAAPAAKEVLVTWKFADHAPVQRTVPLVKLISQVSVPDPKAEEAAQKMAEMAKKVEEMARLAEAEELARREAERKEAADAIVAAEEARLAREQAAKEAREASRRQTRHMLIACGALSVLSAGGIGWFLMRHSAAEKAKAAPRPPAAVFARLQVLGGDATEHSMTATALRIGRGKDNDLTLGNDSVSRHHAEISRTREGLFTITELNAGNGVLVNGKEVEKAVLQHEDIIELGEVRIRFLIPEGEPKAVAP